MISKIAPIGELVQGWCQGTSQIPHSDELRKIVASYFQTHASNPLGKWSLIQTIEREFTQKNSDQQKVDLFKKALEKGWKNRFLDTNYEKVVDFSHFPLNFNNDLNISLHANGRLHSYTSPQICAAIGSCFATNNPALQKKDGHHVLDSLFACRCQGKYGPDFTLALADGAGGHFGDVHQDQRIALASHLGTKTAARIFSAYSSPEELYEALPKIVTSIALEIRRKAKGEGTTLLACRAFSMEEGYRVIGFNLGDCMLMGWHPETKAVYSLCSSHATEMGTAFFPDAYRAFEVQKIDVLLPKGTVLFLMSDGIHDDLPHTEEEKKYPNELGYRSRVLTNFGAIFDRLPQDLSSPDDYVHAVIQASLSYAEVERLKPHDPDFRMGDDISILQCILK